MNGASPSTVWGVNALLTSRRSRVCRGGSALSIACERRSYSPWNSGPTRWRAAAALSDEASGLRRTAITSA
jgi:hypothetical protein